MIQFEHTEVYGWEAAIRGMRNPKNSWDKSDSYAAVDCESCGLIEEKGICKKEDRIGRCREFECYKIGSNDLKLMKTLRQAGTDHRKYLRMITVSVDITAPLYWWKEADTYKVNTVANSCSTMHKLMAKPFEASDFSCEHLTAYSMKHLDDLIIYLNLMRDTYLTLINNNPEAAKEVWWQVIQLLPTSYNQKRTFLLNYEVLNNMCHSRKNHKLDEWSIGFMDWVKTLPYAEELIL